MDFREWENDSREAGPMIEQQSRCQFGHREYDVDVLVFAFVLTVAAVIGKQVCSFGVVEKGLDRISVGIGMIPRGEVGLIFAAYGSSLIAPLLISVGGVTYYVVNSAGAVENIKIIDSSTFSAVVIMVIITTLVTPFVLAWTLKRGDRIKAEQGAKTEEPKAEEPDS